MTSKYGITKVPYEWEHRKKYLQLPFPQSEYDRRIASLRQAMSKNGMSYLLIYSNPACTGPVIYIANYDSFFGNTIVMIPVSGEPSLITDGIMHSEPMHSAIWTTWIKDIRPTSHPATVRHAQNISDFVVDQLKRWGIHNSKGGLVNMNFSPFTFMQRLTDLLPEINLLPADRLFEQVRAIKSDLEIAMLRKTAKMSSLGLNRVFEIDSQGMTEKELAAEAVHTFLAAGSDSPMIALTAGPRSGLKHAPPTEYKIKNGDMLFVDVSTPYQGYMSDVARSGVVGVASRQQVEMLETALEMHDRVIEAIKPGARICDLQKIAEDIANRRGLGDYYFPTGFGHGIGTSIAETPILFPDNEAPLERNMVFALEPMIVIEGVGTAVFEEMILVTETGHEVLSDATVSTWK